MFILCFHRWSYFLFCPSFVANFGTKMFYEDLIDFFVSMDMKLLRHYFILKKNDKKFLTNNNIKYILFNIEVLTLTLSLIDF